MGDCLPYRPGSEQLAVGSRATCCSKNKVHLLPLSLEWEFLKIKNSKINNNNTIIKNICSVCSVYQLPF